MTPRTTRADRLAHPTTRDAVRPPKPAAPACTRSSSAVSARHRRTRPAQASYPRSHRATAPPRLDALATIVAETPRLTRSARDADDLLALAMGFAPDRG
jgi:hypothetical protein